MSAPGARAAITETPAGLTIEIGPVRHWLVAPVMIFFLAVWFWVESESVGFLGEARLVEGARGDWLTAVALFALAIWSYAGCLMLREFVWMALATETVSVGAGLLRIRKEAPLFRTAEEFELSGVHDLHLDDDGGHLCFRAGQRRWTFGRTLMGDEAERVFERIRGRFAPIVRA